MESREFLDIKRITFVDFLGYCELKSWRLLSRHEVH
jgi:hypothetical protein